MEEAQASGMETTCQAVPFQCSMRARRSRLRALYSPTAHASVGERATTPLSVPERAASLGRAGVATRCQAVPSHRSISDRWTQHDVPVELR